MWCTWCWNGKYTPSISRNNPWRMDFRMICPWLHFTLLAINNQFHSPTSCYTYCSYAHDFPIGSRNLLGTLGCGEPAILGHPSWLLVEFMKLRSQQLGTPHVDFWRCSLLPKMWLGNLLGTLLTLNQWWTSDEPVMDQWWTSDELTCLSHMINMGVHGY